jgi:hypothetical protein
MKFCNFWGWHKDCFNAGTICFLSSNEVPDMAMSKSVAAAQPSNSGALILGTGLAFASLILLPAVATRIGMGAALTGAMRIALMRASSRVVTGNGAHGEAAPTFSCH